MMIPKAFQVTLPFSPRMLLSVQGAGFFPWGDSVINYGVSMNLMVLAMQRSIALLISAVLLIRVMHFGAESGIIWLSIFLSFLPCLFFMIHEQLLFRYSWFVHFSPLSKLMVLKFLTTIVYHFFLFYPYDSWFMIPLPPQTTLISC